MTIHKATLHTPSGKHTTDSNSKQLAEMQLKAGIDAIESAKKYKPKSFGDIFLECFVTMIIVYAIIFGVARWLL